MSTVTVHHGDSREVLKGLPANSVDAVVTDPPYGLGASPDVAAMLTAWLEGREYIPRSKGGFMGKAWDAFVPGPAVWRECFRVLKPGGYLLAFFGTRTEDVGSIAIRLAGFERRDMLAWLYGSGFPKSLDIAKAFDKADLNIIRGRAGRSGQSFGQEYVRTPKGDPIGENAIVWDGWGTALKPALEPVVFAQKPMSEGTYAANVLKHGVGALNIDACRVGDEGGTQAVNFTDRWAGVGDGKGARNEIAQLDKGRWPANVVHDGSGEVAEIFPVDARVSGGTSAGGLGYHGGAAGHERRDVGFGDSGSAARFFYSAKADADGRLGSKHPTVKPVDLMRWLATLVTPPGGVLLDPFAGTGTTGVAALGAGFDAILIERDAESVADIELRLAHARGEAAHSSTLKARNRPPKPSAAGDLFSGDPT